MSVEDLYNLPDDPSAVAARLRQDLDEIKGKQLIGQTFKTFGVTSVDPWDMSATLDQGESNRFLITFNYANATDHAVTAMTFFYRLDNPDVMDDPMPRKPQTNPNVDVQAHKVSDDETSSTWELIIQNTSAVAATYTGYVKLFFASTDNGDFSIAII